MRNNIVVIGLLSIGIGMVATSAARADCESDMLQLEEAYKKPGLSPTAMKALDEAKTASVSAMKKDDDAGCHKAIAAGLPAAGMTLK